MVNGKEPREGHIRVAGIAWLARMIDKARLEARGEIGRFDLDYPCPLDTQLLEQFGLSSEEFQRIVTSVQTDEEILQELRRRSALEV